MARRFSSFKCKKMAQLIRDSLGQRLGQRERNGTVFSERVWALLFRKVVFMLQQADQNLESVGGDNSRRSIVSAADTDGGISTHDGTASPVQQPRLRMAELLCSIVKPQHSLAVKAFDYFRELYVALETRFTQLARDARAANLSMASSGLRYFDFTHCSRKFIFQHASNAAVAFLAVLFVDHAQRYVFHDSSPLSNSV